MLKESNVRCKHSRRGKKCSTESRVAVELPHVYPASHCQCYALAVGISGNLGITQHQHSRSS